MQLDYREFVFVTVILLAVVTSSGKSTEIQTSYGFAKINIHRLAFTPSDVLEPITIKQSDQLDSSLNNFVDTNTKILIHIHPYLNVTLNGKPLIVPNGIGINSSIWKDHSLDQFGMQPMKMTMGGTSMIMQGMSPLHTHDNSGTIHVESNEITNYTLGQFLKNWGLDLTDKIVKLTVDAKPTYDYRNHVLKDKEQMLLDIEDQKNETSR